MAHKRFQEWREAGVFEEFWGRGLLMYDETKGLDWKWLSLDGAMTKSPLGGESTGPNPTDRAKKGLKEVCSQRPPEFLCLSNLPEQTSMTSNLSNKHLRIFK